MATLSLGQPKHYRPIVGRDARQSDCHQRFFSCDFAVDGDVAVSSSERDFGQGITFAVGRRHNRTCFKVDKRAGI